MEKKKRKILEPQERFQKKRRKDKLAKVGYGFLVLMALVGIGIFIGIFFSKGMATVEGQKLVVGWSWYVIAGALIAPAWLVSVWKIFWIKEMLQSLKKRGGGGEWQRIVAGVPIKGVRRHLKLKEGGGQWAQNQR